MKSILLFLALIVTTYSFAQDQSNEKITEYFDKDWKTIVDPAAASFYRTVEQAEDSLITVRDYFISGKIQMVALCSSTTPKLIFHGKRTLYLENGVVSHEGSFENNERVGTHRSFYENGNLRQVINYDKDKARYIQFLSEKGENLLPNGTGVIKEISDDKLRTNHTEIEDSVAIASYSVDHQTNDTVYTLVEKYPEYASGLQQMMHDIGSALKYPKSARRMGIAGTVFVQFIVSKEGYVKNCKVIKGIQDECDEEARRAVSQLGRWNPGKHRNKPVQVRFVLPVKFKFS